MIDNSYNHLGMGERILNLRKARGMTQADFAERLGISPQAVSKWETGLAYPDISMLPIVARELGVPIDILFTEIHIEEQGKAPDSPLFTEPEEDPRPAQQTRDARSSDQLYFDAINFSRLPRQIDVVILHDPTQPSGWHLQSSLQIEEILEIFIAGSTLHVEGLPGFSDDCGEGIFKSLKQGFSKLKNQWQVEGQLTINCPEERLRSIEIEAMASSDISSHVDVEDLKINSYGAGDFKFRQVGSVDYSSYGAGDFQADSARQVDFRSYGSGELRIAQILGGDVKIKINGAGDSYMGGRARHLTFVGNGAGELDARELVCQDLDCRITGAGNCLVGRVTGQVKERINLAGSLKILNREPEI